jgi:hypothetical protein
MIQRHFPCHSEGAEGDRRISEFEMLRFAQHDKKELKSWALPDQDGTQGAPYKNAG